MWHRVNLRGTDISEERITSILRVEKSASKEPACEVASRLSHQSKTPSLYKNREREGEWATWEINRGEG
jgi:hypothetical protein